MSADETSLYIAPDGGARCRWCEAPGFPAYLHYHDREWGFPVADDLRLYEKLCLEGFQSGLSWRTILAKREAFRAAFAGFDFERVAAFGPADVERLLQDAGIVRHRGKIAAAIHNAARALELRAECGSLAAFFWRYEEAATPGWRAESERSRALSKDLKKRGWKFVGPTTMYALMQAMGLVNDHHPACVTHGRVLEARRAFRVPT